MRLLDRYLLRELLVPLCYCLAGFFIFWISFNLFADLGEFQKYRLTFGDVVMYYVAIAPDLMTLVLPFSLLLGTLYALTNHARHNELTAMRAAGMSWWRIAAPYLGMGLVFTATYFAVDEYWGTGSRERADGILHRHETDRVIDPLTGRTAGKDGKPVSHVWQENIAFANERAGRRWSIQRYNTATHEMERVIVLQVEADGKRVEYYANEAAYTNSSWAFRNLNVITYQSAEDQFPTKERMDEVIRKDFTETPELIQSEIRIRSMTAVQAAKRPQLSLREIRNYLFLHPQLSPRVDHLVRTQYYSRLAAPWTCLVVVLIALPFGAAPGRRNVFVGVASSIFICFAYFILQRVCLYLGIGGHMSPLLAGWMPNLLFGATGVVLTERTQ